MPCCCQHCNSNEHLWYNCSILENEALRQKRRLYEAAVNTDRKMKGVPFLVNSIVAKPMLKKIAQKLDLHSSGRYGCPLFIQIKTIKQFQKAILEKLTDIHQKSISCPSVYLIKNPIPNLTNEECPICFSRNTNISTNCHHSFCAKCTITHLQAKNDGCQSCPICRQTINTLLYDDKKTLPKNSIRKINANMGSFYLKYKCYSPNWDKKSVLPENNNNENDEDYFEFIPPMSIFEDEENDDDDEDYIYEENDDNEDDDDDDDDYASEDDDDNNEEENNSNGVNENSSLRTNNGIIEENISVIRVRLNQDNEIIRVSSRLSRRFNSFRMRIVKYLEKNSIFFKKTEPEKEKTFHQLFYEMRQQGVYVRRNGFRFRRGDFIL